MYLCVYRCQQRPEKNARSPGAGATGDYELPKMSVEILNLGSLVEHQVLLIAESSLQQRITLILR